MGSGREFLPRGGVPHDIAARGEDERPRTRHAGGRIVGAGGAGGGGFVVGLPMIERPPTATDFNLFSTLVGRTAANTPLVFPVAVQIPENNVGAIRSISILANNLLITSNILWALRFNENAVPGWNALTINPRAAGSVELSFTPEETQLPVPEGSLVDVELTVLDGGTYQVSVAVHGWFYSTSLAGLAAQAI